MWIHIILIEIRIQEANETDPKDFDPDSRGKIILIPRIRNHISSIFCPIVVKFGPHNITSNLPLPLLAARDQWLDIMVDQIEVLMS